MIREINAYLLKPNRIRGGREIEVKEGVPSDKLEKKTYCKKKIAAFVCLICDKLYRGPCHSAVSEQFFISNLLVICSDHEDVKLTSKLTPTKFY